MATPDQGKRVYRSVVLAAILHDIGKFLQRGTFPGLRIEGQHPKVSADFVRLFKADFGQSTDADLLETLVQRHHEDRGNFGPELLVQEASSEVRGYCYLVSRADSLSSYERGPRSEQYQDYKNTPLVSIFSSLTLDYRQTPSALEHGTFELTEPASLERAFPRPGTGYLPGELTGQLEFFGTAFTWLREALARANAWQRFDVVFSHVYALLERFTSCIPANTQEAVPDISLFDHLRTTVAIAACLFQYHANPLALTPEILDSPPEPEFLMVAGDASGIQSYIFEVTREGTGRVARRLRARSLQVQLLLESVASRLLGRLDLPPVNRLMASGGKFYVLLPNTESARAALADVRSEVEQWCLEHMGGELTIHLASVPIASSSFRAEASETVKETFGDRLVTLNATLADEKRRRHCPTGKLWSNLLLPDPYQGEQPCVSCRKFPQLANDPDHFCQWCRSDADVGRQLPRARLLRLCSDATEGLRLFGDAAQPLAGPSGLRGEDRVVLLNSWDTNEYARRPVQARFLANHVPRDEEGAPITFEKMAEKARGRHMLGFLKADVDNLGETFAFGLRGSEHRRDTVSRLATLSRMLDAFFSGWVQRLLETPEFDDCYTVFSGGDDLFVVGPWDKTLDLALRVREDFRRWVGRDDLTLSAGLVLGADTLPMPEAATDVEHALENAKREGRDRISFLGRTLAWERYASRIIPRWQSLLPAVEETPSASLYRLLGIGRMWETYLADRGKNASALRSHPLLAYAAARDQRLQQPPFRDWLAPALRLAPLTSEARAVLDDMALVAELLLYSKREDRR